MTTPITGPFTKSGFLYDIPHWVNGPNINYKWKFSRTWRRQRKPYDLPLVFDFWDKTGNSLYTSTGPYGTFSGSSTDATSVVSDTMSMDGNIYNKAYGRFVDAMGDAVQGGVATAEGRQAMSMVTTRLTQMAKFTRHVATGRFGQAAKDLGVDWEKPSPSRKGRKKPLIPESLRPKSDRARESARSFSSIYLEFHFGWSPLMQDIHDAIEVLDKPLKPHRVKASATGSFADPLNFHSVTSDSGWNYTEDRNGQYVQTVKLQGDLIITNPNLAMMQQFGILNPASIAWELVPFSFVLDWFVNVGDYLNSFTDFAGVNFLNAHRTVFTRYNGSYYKDSIAKSPSVNNTSHDKWKNSSVNCYRRLDLGTGPSVRLRTPKPWGVRRGLAAASLLMQRFPKRVIEENAIHLAQKRTAFRANNFPAFNGKYF